MMLKQRENKLNILRSAVKQADAYWELKDYDRYFYQRWEEAEDHLFLCLNLFAGRKDYVPTIGKLGGKVSTNERKTSRHLRKTSCS